jgi:hypothetical protein
MENTFRRLSVIVMVALGLAAASPSPADAAGTQRYAAPGGQTIGNCTSWATACELRYVLGSVAVSGDAIWVAQGLYRPTSEPAVRSASFIIPSGVAVYGGFEVGGTLAARDPESHVTILSGDIDSDDTNGDLNNIAETDADLQGNNSYHVVKMDGSSTLVTGTTILDGFVITAGKANGGGFDNEGAGLRCNGRDPGHVCSPTLAKLTFSGNLAAYGGAMFIDGSSGGVGSPSLSDVSFSGNRASGGWGGAIYNAAYDGGTSSPSLLNVTFSGNTAFTNGGAVMNDARSSAVYCCGTSSPTLTNVTFTNNGAGLSGGALYNNGSGSGGGSNAVSSPILKNVTFSGNSAGTGGGAMYNDGHSGGSSHPTLTNAIVWGNTVGGGGSGPAIYNDSAAPTISYSVMQVDCTAVVGDVCGAGNLVTDPKLDALGSNGGYTKTMALLAGSSAIGTGEPNVCAAPPVNGFDQRGVSRMACDIGAYQAEVEGVFDDNRPGWTFTGTWLMAPSPGAYNNTLHLARSAGGTAEYTFTTAAWRTFSVTYLRMPGLGNLEVYLDAGVTPLTTIATNGPAKLLSYVGPALTVGSHTVKLRRAGAGVVAFDLLEQILAKGDDRSPGITYAGGGWTDVAVPAAYLGTLKYATVTNATASFGFTGSRFSLTAAKSPGWGNLEVYMDGSGTPLATLKYDATPAGFWTYTTPSLGAAAHTVVLKYVSASPHYVALDSFVIRP